MNNSCHKTGQIDEVDEMIRNAELRTELEPYLDEAISRVNVQSWTLRSENDFLESMLSWERAPLLPIYQWFDPPLILPSTVSMSDKELEVLLAETLERLFSKGIILDYTDHLTDRELYNVIVNEILPLEDKKIDDPTVFHHWNCCTKDDEDHIDTWLAYYASDEEREDWCNATGEQLPPKVYVVRKRHVPGGNL
ncbi:MAG: hypothetical protein PHQ75_01190 [Thermoguttaceae bacterium]|nr:hypothetical protein [Thermoguttaceae bacterium]